MEGSKIRGNDWERSLCCVKIQKLFLKASKIAIEPFRGTQEMTIQSAPSKPQSVIYARVSSKEQEKEGYSIPAQLRLL